MIFEFLDDRRMVELVPQVVREGRSPHLFSADSMTLVVGPNDSGKTDLLARICRHVFEEESERFRSKVPASDIGVIYYSPAPFDVDRFPSSRGRRIRILSPKSGKSVLNPEILERLKDSFGFTSSKKLKLKFLPEDGLRALLSISMEIPTRIGDFPELKPALKNYQTASIDWHRMDESGASSSDRQGAMLDAQAALKHAIEDLVRQRLGRRANLYLIALGVIHKNQKLARRAASEFWAFLDGDREGKRLERAVGDLNDLARFYPLEQLESGIELEDVASFDQLKPFLHYVVIELDGLSSGAEALVKQFDMIGSAIDGMSKYSKIKSILVLIDEGDAFLHLAWQQRYVEALDQFVSSRRPVGIPIQVVLATHSPVLMSDFPRDYIVRMKGKDEVLRDVVSFAAPLEKIVENTAGAGAIGKHAARIIAEQINGGKDADPRIVEWIDDPLLSSFLAKRINHAG